MTALYVISTPQEEQGEKTEGMALTVSHNLDIAPHFHFCPIGQNSSYDHSQDEGIGACKLYSDWSHITKDQECPPRKMTRIDKVGQLATSASEGTCLLKTYQAENNGDIVSLPLFLLRLFSGLLLTVLPSPLQLQP